MKRWGSVSLWVACLLVGLSGCADYWDEVSSRDFKFKNLYHKPSPMEVLRDSTDGAKRGRALAKLAEPTRHGGTQQEQDKMIEILGAAALKDREPLCRLGAIKALSEYKDPRAAKILEEVYLQKPVFTPEINNIIKQQSLTALATRDTPEVRQLLVRVARQPSGSPVSSYADQQLTIDERLTAIRGLANFKSSDSLDALVYVLETEKDVALRDRAHESLKELTGKRYPAEAKVWRDFVNNPVKGAVHAREEPNGLQKILILTGAKGK